MISPRAAWRIFVELERLNRAILYADIAYVLASGDKAGMDEGWPQHVALGRYVDERPLPHKAWLN